MFNAGGCAGKLVGKGAENRNPAKETRYNKEQHKNSMIDNAGASDNFSEEEISSYYNSRNSL